VTIVLGGCPATGYSAPVTIDGQPLQLAVDTGSTDLAVALTSCANCSTEASLNPTNSICGTTAVSASYGDGSGWNGDVCSSTVQLGGEVPAVTMDFAGIKHQVNGFFRGQDCAGNSVPNSPIDGIMGLGPLDLSDIGNTANDAYVNELVAQGVADDFAILLCTQGGGDMWLGGYDASFASGPAQFTPLTGGGFWAVNLSAIGIGTGGAAHDLAGSDAEAIVDTGTEVFFMPPSAYTALASFLSTDSGATSIFGSGVLNRRFFDQFNCATPTGGQTRAEVDAALPPLTLTFPDASGAGSFTLVLPATQSYLALTPGSATQYCAGVANSGSNQTGNTIIGDAVLGSNITIFDIQQHQIGFAPQTTCD
jgi:hypothetical protein